MSGKTFYPPTKSENYEFLLRIYFDELVFQDQLGACINRAYRDFSRTLHGMGSFTNKDILRQKAQDYLTHRFNMIIESAIKVQNFDAWHSETRQGLIEIYLMNGFENFTLGQAQKWINMTFKYARLFDSIEKTYKHVISYCHLPIDNIIIEKLKDKGAPPLSTTWSRMKDEAEYMRFQLWVRTHFAGSAPLDVEFHLWTA